MTKVVKVEKVAKVTLTMTMNLVIATKGLTIKTMMKINMQIMIPGVFFSLGLPLKCLSTEKLI